MPLVNPIINDNSPDQTGILMWQGSATTTNGQATFAILDDNKIDAFFTGITSIVATASNNTTTPTNYTFTSIKSISNDLKSIIINVGQGTNLLSLGNTIVNASDGTLVYIIVCGY